MKKIVFFGSGAAALGLLLLAVLSWEEFTKLDLSRGIQRSAWQQPERVVASLGLSPGDVVADVGVGNGYFVYHLADAVGPAGRVYAVDVSEGKLRNLAEKAEAKGYGNIETVLAEPGDPRLPEGEVDLVFVCNTYHHLEDRADYFTRLRTDLAPGGRVAVVEYRADVRGIARLYLSSGHWTAKALLLEEMIAAGYRSERGFDFLAVQSFEIFAAAP